MSNADVIRNSLIEKYKLGNHRLIPNDFDDISTGKIMLKMNTPRVLITWRLKESTLKHFSDAIEFICIPGQGDAVEETAELIHDVQGLMVLGIQVNKELIDKGTHLQVISNLAVGYDNIDVAYANQKGIVVSNTPHSVTAPTAQLAIGLLLNLTRKISILDTAVKAQEYSSWSLPLMSGVSVEGLTIGIMGWGRIGAAVATLAQALGMHVVYNKRTRLEPTLEEQLNIQYKTPKSLFAEADIVSLHMPLNTETKNMINKDLLSLMKPTAYLINTARGGVIDPDDLYDLLSQQQIAGAALDVFWDEPHIPQRYRELDNVILTPHIGTNSKKGRKDMLIEVHENIVAFFERGEVISRVEI